MSEDIIGTDREEFTFDDFDLLELSEKTKEMWILPVRSLLHNTISCIISMRLSDRKTREIKTKIYNSIGNEDTTEITMKNFTFKDKTLLGYGLSKDQIYLIRKVLELSVNKEAFEIKDLTKIKGIGIYLIRLLKIITGIDADVSLEQDYHIRNILSILYGYKKVMTETEARKILKTWKKKSQICYFLWRLKSDSVFKILEKQNLNQYDFLGRDEQEEKE